MWNQVIGVNLTGTFLMCRAAIPALLESDHAAIVNFSSTSAAFGHPYMAAYAASKGGIDAMTHTLAIEYGKRGIRVTAVAPGSIQSGITETTGGMIPGDADWAPVRQDVADRRRGLRAARRRRVGDRHARLRRRPLRHRHRPPHRRRRPRLTTPFTLRRWYVVSGYERRSFERWERHGERGGGTGGAGHGREPGRDRHRRRDPAGGRGGEGRDHRAVGRRPRAHVRRDRDPRGHRAGAAVRPRGARRRTRQPRGAHAKPSSGPSTSW